MFTKNCFYKKEILIILWSYSVDNSFIIFLWSHKADSHNNQDYLDLILHIISCISVPKYQKLIPQEKGVKLQNSFISLKKKLNNNEP
jgi:hypothetical protein